MEETAEGHVVVSLERLLRHGAGLGWCRVDTVKVWPESDYSTLPTQELVRRGLGHS